MRLSVLAIRPPDLRCAAVERRYFQAAPEPPVLPQPTRGYLVKRIHKSYYLPDCVYLDCVYLDCAYSNCVGLNCVGSNCIDVQKSRHVLIHEFGSRVQPVDLSADSIRRLRSWRHGPFASSACYSCTRALLRAALARFTMGSVHGRRVYVPLLIFFFTLTCML